MSSQRLGSIQNRLHGIAREIGEFLELPENVAPYTDIGLRQQSIAVCGMLERGKSSFINAIFLHNLLPVKIPPNLSALSCYHISVTNAVPSFIKAHLSSNIVENVETKAISMAQLEAWGSKLEFIEIQHENSNLPKGFQLIETPSIGSVDFESRTRSILKEVGNVVLVIDANFSLSKGEIEFLKLLPENIRSIIIAANKIDVAGPQVYSDYTRQIIEQIKTLELAVTVDVFAISLQSLAEDRESHEWQKLTAKIVYLAQASVQLADRETTYIIDQATRLLQAAENLQVQLNIKDKLATKNIPNNNSSKKIAEIKWTKKLIQDVIDDQTQDILKTVRNSFEAVIFQIESDIRANNKDPQSVKYDLQRWLEREQNRVKERLERHFRSILDDTNYAVGKTYTLSVHLDEIRVNPVQEVNVSSPNQSLFEEYQRMGGSFGVGAATTIASLLFSGGRLLVSFTVGGVIATCAWLVVDNLLLAPSKATVKIPDLSGVIMSEFERSVRHNTERLSDIVERAFAEAIANGQSQPPSSSNLDNKNISDELKSIIAELKTMIKE